MKIAITGATGLVGQALANYFSQAGNQVSVLSRKKSPTVVYWNPVTGDLDRNQLEGMDVIIHLAGANVAERRWSKSYKKIIRDSRVNPTRFLVDNIRLLKQKPKLFISASAVGFYGSSLMKDYKDERSSRGMGFLADVCEEWEEETKALVEMKIRVVQLRLGMVLSKKGGALAKMLPVFKMGLGGKLGKGHQPISWVSIDEIPTIVDFIIQHDSMYGPVNVVAPEVVTNEDFSHTLCSVLHRPTTSRVPAFMIKFLLGEMGEELLLNGVNVFPNTLVKNGYEFRFPHLKEALINILK